MVPSAIKSKVSNDYADLSFSYLLQINYENFCHIASVCIEQIGLKRRQIINTLIGSLLYAQSSSRRFRLLNLLMSLLPVEYFELLFKMIETEDACLFLTVRGCLTTICKLITQEAQVTIVLNFNATIGPWNVQVHDSNTLIHVLVYSLGQRANACKLYWNSTSILQVFELIFSPEKEASIS
nr:auxin transport protein BIG [Tanacetum cinerariifolium]